MDESRLSLLNEAQREVLRMLFRRVPPKEIGAKLSISPSTVHQRLTKARQLLGVATSMEAARLLAEAERADIYEGVTYDAIPLDLAENRGFLRSVSRLQLPWSTSRRPDNDMTLFQKILVITLLASFVLAATGVLAIGIRAFSEGL